MNLLSCSRGSKLKVKSPFVKCIGNFLVNQNCMNLAALQNPQFGISDRQIELEHTSTPSVVDRRLGSPRVHLEFMPGARAAFVGPLSATCPCQTPGTNGQTEQESGPQPPLQCPTAVPHSHWKLTSTSKVKTKVSQAGHQACRCVVPRDTQ